MMKKVLLSVLFLWMPLYYVEAQIQEEVVELQVSFGDNSGTHDPRPKAPAQKPTIFSTNPSLYLWTSN